MIDLDVERRAVNCVVMVFLFDGVDVVGEGEDVECLICMDNKF